ncbi:acetyltransferase [Glycomyces sp. A-F 0318]|uniref:GNAT family N-acetyltransferase n=1 Tax=Glycomyces amatae TaxID=2881355 RepID=UPI001E34AF68|nr:GNAT family N-acetyltransferase [Glycomyces amatae]MCD0445027.1 acetyltransferase [Glycomyces amatae]
MQITWRPLTEADFPLLADWLSRPHVHRYWHHDHSPEGVARDFGPGTRGEEAGEDLLVSVDGRPIGLVQRSRIDDYAEDFEKLRAIVDVPPGAVTIDYFIGDPALTGRGLGTAIIRAVVADTWSAYPAAPAVVVGVVAGNVASWRALEKAGFRRVGEGDMEPDNPVDPPLHFVSRIDRPAQPGASQ